MRPIARLAVVAALAAAVTLAPIAQKGAHALSPAHRLAYASGACTGKGFQIYQNSDGSGYCEQFQGAATINNLNDTLWPGCSFFCNVYPNAWSSQGEGGSFGAGIGCSAPNGTNQTNASLSPGRSVTAMPAQCGFRVITFSYSNA